METRQANQFDDLRSRMVEGQLRPRGIRDPRVLAAMSNVPREDFVAAGYENEAYQDWPLPIGYSQTISQPYTVGFMVEAAQLDGSENVLEIGTGSGYGAAVLSQLAHTVHTIERLPQLCQAARHRLAQLGYDNVHVHQGDGSLGLRDFAPFDAIVVTAGAMQLPAPYREQIADGGRIVIPIGDSICQSIYRFTRCGRELTGTDLGHFVFVPLIGKYGWSGDE